MQLNGKSLFAVTVRANAYRLKGDMDRAIADCTQALELNPKYAYAYTIRALAYRAKGNIDQANKDQARANELNNPGK